MRRNHLKEFYKNKLMQLFEAQAQGGPPVPWQPPPEQNPWPQPRPDAPRPNEPGYLSPFLNPDPEDTPGQGKPSQVNPHHPVFRPAGIHPDLWHPIPNTNPPRYYHDFYGNGWGQGYVWNPETQKFDPVGGPTRIPEGMPGYNPNPSVPVLPGHQHYMDPNGNLYARDANGTIYFWDRSTNKWVEITDPSYLPTQPKWITPPSGLTPQGPNGPSYIPSPWPSMPQLPGVGDGPPEIGPRPRRPGFGGIIDRFKPYRPLGFPGSLP